MGRLWEYHQNPKDWSPDLSVQRGMCTAMSYYVIKRILAGLPTSPDVLDRQMGHFASTMRAYFWVPKISGRKFAKMLADGDNFRTEILQAVPLAGSKASEQLGEFANKAIPTAKTVPDPAVAFFIGLFFTHTPAGHAIAWVTYKNPEKSIVFDPNLGMYEFAGKPDEAFNNEFDKVYPGMIEDLYPMMVRGAPRKIELLAAD
jgi:hypothetical protein